MTSSDALLDEFACAMRDYAIRELLEVAPDLLPYGRIASLAAIIGDFARGALEQERALDVFASSHGG